MSDVPALRASDAIANMRSRFCVNTPRKDGEGRTGTIRHRLPEPPLVRVFA
jgi:hypothetical protein